MHGATLHAAYCLQKIYLTLSKNALSQRLLQERSLRTRRRTNKAHTNTPTHTHTHGDQKNYIAYLKNFLIPRCSQYPASRRLRRPAALSSFVS